MRVGRLVLCALLVVAVTSCARPGSGASEDTGSGNDPRPAGESRRERLLASCPAEAPDPFTDQPAPANGGDAYEFEMEMAENQQQLNTAVGDAED